MKRSLCLSGRITSRKARRPRVDPSPAQRRGAWGGWRSEGPPGWGRRFPSLFARRSSQTTSLWQRDLAGYILPGDGGRIETANWKSATNWNHADFRFLSKRLLWITTVEIPRAPLVLNTPAGQVTILNEPTYSFGSADNLRTYDLEIRLDNENPTSVHGVRTDGRWSAILGANGDLLPSINILPSRSMVACILLWVTGWSA
jgi:hypothetical protein